QAIQSGVLRDVETVHLEGLNLSVPVAIPGIEPSILQPKKTWADSDAYDLEMADLCKQFVDNFSKFDVDENIIAAGPRLAE
ncbi:MAG: phosphoenolpyruvate carboxykinase (ATP), partial [Enterobacterales bacterium]